jgi:hypothetical protein
MVESRLATLRGRRDPGPAGRMVMPVSACRAANFKAASRCLTAGVADNKRAGQSQQKGGKPHTRCCRRVYAIALLIEGDYLLFG